MPHAFLWENGVTTDLGVLPGDEDSGAAAINNAGQIVGSSGRTDRTPTKPSIDPYLRTTLGSRIVCAITSVTEVYEQTI